MTLDIAATGLLKMRLVALKSSGTNCEPDASGGLRPPEAWRSQLDIQDGAKMIVVSNLALGPDLQCNKCNSGHSFMPIQLGLLVA